MYRDTAKETFSESSSSSVKKYIVDWNQRAAFLDDLLGYAYTQSGKLYRVLPDQHPDLYNFYALEASIDPEGAPSVSGRKSSWKRALITVTYRPVNWDVKSDEQVTTELDRYVQKEYSEAADMLTLQSYFKFCQRDAILQSQPGMIQPFLECTYTWKQVPANNSSPYKIPNESTVRDLIGTVNNATFDGRAKGTVLFAGVEPKPITPKLSSATSKWLYWDIAYKFIIRDNGPVTISSTTEQAGHNYIFDSAYGRYDLVTAGTNAGLTTGQRIYEYSDFSQLFTVSW
jgi:uncharacterized protein Usg